MNYSDFLSNELVVKIIGELENDNVKIKDRKENAVNITIYDSYIANFKLVTGQKEDYLLEILKNEYKDSYKFILCRAKKNNPYALWMISMDLVFYTIIKHFSEKLEKYLLYLLGGKENDAKEAAKPILVDYNKVLMVNKG